jgi:UDP-N-acetylmuramate dehydrogenase
MTALAPNDLLTGLPAVRGRLIPEGALAPQSWFRVGGPAELLFRPADVEDLARLLEAWPSEMPVHVLGAASNVIIRDGGVPGLVVRLARGFAEVEIERDGLIAGAAMLDVILAEHAAAAGLTGLEFMSGIPGSVGGAVAMNAGAYGGDVSQALDWIEVVTGDGDLVRIPAKALHLTYRHAMLPVGTVVARARFRAQPGDPDAIAERMNQIRVSREATQPIRSRTGGSTFRNPPDMKAWELIDAAGCRGLIIGGAQVSEKHCNFLLNLGEATAADLENLGEEVRRRVLETSGVMLEWEIKRIGKKLGATP